MKRFAMATIAYGLLRSWCWFTFLEGTAASVMAATFVLPLHVLAALFIAGSAAFALPAAFLLHGRLHQHDKNARFLPAAGGCFLMVWIVLLRFIPHAGTADALGVLTASAGFIGLSLLCALAFFEMGVRRAAVAQCGVSAFSVVFLLPWLAMGTFTATLYVMVFLPVAAALSVLYFEAPEATEDVSEAAPSLEKADCVKIARYVGLSLLVNLCCGTLHSLITSARSQVYSEFYFLSNISYFCCSLLLGWALLRFPKMRFRSICTISIPLMAAGFVLFPLLDTRQPLVCFLLLQAGFAAFNVYEWTYLLSAAGLFRKRDVPLVLGAGMFLWNATTLVGIALPERALAFLGATLVEYPAALAAIAGICLCLAWLLTPDDIVPGAGREAVPETFAIPTLPAPPPECRLTRQETVIVDMLGAGMKNSEMCAALNIAESTLRTHLKNIYRKTGIEKRKDLASLGKDGRIVRR